MQWFLALSLRKKLELIAVLLLVPFWFGYFWHGHIGNVIGAIATSFFFFLSFITPENHRYYVIAKALTSLAPGLVIWGIVSISPEYATYWSFPLMLFLYFQLSLRKAIAANVLFIGVLTLLLGRYLDPAMVARFVAAQVLANSFAIFFSHDRQQNEQRLRQLVVTDSLTGLYNRREAMRAIQEALEIKARYGQSSTLLIIDLDHFKKINDQHGHIKGDEVLIAVSHLMKERVRSADMLARLGGEEFLLLLRHTGLVQGREVAEHLIQSCREQVHSIPEKVTISIGIAECGDSYSLTSWLKAADDALYRAKQEGRDTLMCAPTLTGKRKVA